MLVKTGLELQWPRGDNAVCMYQGGFKREWGTQVHKSQEEVRDKKGSKDEAMKGERAQEG